MKKLAIWVVVVCAVGFGMPATAGEWTPIDPENSPTARQGHSMVTLPDGRVLLFGGQGADGSLKNDLAAFANGDWNTIIPDNAPPPARRDHTVWFSDGEMLVLGGVGDEGALEDLWSYDPAANEWSEKTMTNPPPARHGHSATLMSNGDTLLFGGTDSEGVVSKEFGILHPDLSYEQLGDAPKAYSDHTAVLTADEDYFVVFGEPGIFEFYDFSAEMWGTLSGGPPLAGGATSFTRENDQGETIVLMLGGIDDEGNDNTKIYEFNTATGELTALPDDMPAGMVNGAGVSLGGGALDGSKVEEVYGLLFGGLDDGVYVDTTYYYATGGSVPPTVTVLEPSGDDVANTEFTITWDSFDPDSVATVALYWDADDQNFDGTLIVDNLTEDEDDSYAWNVSSLAEDEYWVYAVVDDGVNEPARVYSSGPLTVDHSVDDDTVDDDTVDDDAVDDDAVDDDTVDDDAVDDDTVDDDATDDDADDDSDDDDGAFDDDLSDDDATGDDDDDDDSGCGC